MSCCQLALSNTLENAFLQEGFLGAPLYVILAYVPMTAKPLSQTLLKSEPHRPNEAKMRRPEC